MSKTENGAAGQGGSGSRTYQITTRIARGLLQSAGAASTETARSNMCQVNVGKLHNPWTSTKQLCAWATDGKMLTALVLDRQSGLRCKGAVARHDLEVLVRSAGKVGLTVRVSERGTVEWSTQGAIPRSCNVEPPDVNHTLARLGGAHLDEVKIGMNPGQMRIVSDIAKAAGTYGKLEACVELLVREQSDPIGWRVDGPDGELFGELAPFPYVSAKRLRG